MEHASSTRFSRVLALCILCMAAQPARDPIVHPQACAQTAPMPHSGDSADDPAIWLHPRDPALSLILGTDKQGGLHVFNMDGLRRQIASEKSMPNNVDLIYSMSIGGRSIDVAVASVRAPGASGVKVWSIDPEARRLSDITSSRVIPVFGGHTPYGICTYHSPTGKCYFFVNNYGGEVEQYLLRDVGDGTISATRVRAFKLGSITEGCVADDELGWFYIAEERVGIWKFSAEPDGGDSRTLVAKVGEHGLVADVEGLTIYYAAGGKGYLIASSQGSNTFKVYERASPHRFLLTIDPAPGKIDDVNDTDGIAVISCPTSGDFARGLLVVQDGQNSSGNQNFKLYRWEEIAGDRLLIDTSWNPRATARSFTSRD